MTERGLPIVDGAPACPFVAFDDDRDERATSPDHRHRCYAEAQPAPRALAHQEAYCLSSAFPVCPTFQDWARREAARAQGDQVVGGAEGRGSSPADLELPPLAADRPPRRNGHTWAAPPPWLRPTSGSPASASGTASDASIAGSGPTRVSGSRPVPPAAPVADEAPHAPGPGRYDAAAAAAGGLTGSFADRLTSGLGGPRPDVRPHGPSAAARPPAPMAAGDEREEWGGSADSRGAPNAVPAVAAAEHRGDGNATMEDLPPRGRRREHERIEAAKEHDDEGREHDAYAPAWERPRRLEAYPTLRSRRLPAMLVTPLLLAIAALVLVGAALFFLPSLLGLGKAPGAGASIAATSTGSAAPSVPVQPTPLPQATPTVYLVQPGDTMSRIAQKFNVPLTDLIAANQATIPNPDKLKIGDAVTIPVPLASVLPGASSAP
jgi:hypothetical protein